MAKLNLTDVDLVVYAHMGHNIGCKYNGARWHLWIDPVTLQAHVPMSCAEAVLYKNPEAANLRPSDPGYFTTRRLPITGNGIANKIATQLLAMVPELLPAAQAKFDAKLAEEERKNAALRQAKRIQDAAPQMVDVILGLIRVIGATAIMQDVPEYNAARAVLKQINHDEFAK